MIRFQALARVIVSAAMVTALGTFGSMAAQAAGDSVLKATELQKQFPPSVYYAGQIAPVQLRNTGGVKFGDGHYVLAGLVDTSGYSSGVAAKYQGYLIAEVPIEIGGKHLAAGAYGFGFLDGGEFLVTDLGGKDVLKASYAKDSAITRPRPLEVTPDPAGGFRLYSGRNYVQFNR